MPITSSAFVFIPTPTTQIYTLSLHDALPILVVLLPFQLLRLSLATPSRWTPLAITGVEIGRRFSRNAETELVCRLLLEKKNAASGPHGLRSRRPPDRPHHPIHGGRRGNRPGV